MAPADHDFLAQRIASKYSPFPLPPVTGCMMLHRIAAPAAAIGTICQKTHCTDWGTAHVWRSGDNMASRDEYVLRAAELNALAQVENDHADKLEFENLARAYLRLAKQAERYSQTDVIYETLPRKKRDRA
jgi:hypothetical protein